MNWLKRLKKSVSYSDLGWEERVEQRLTLYPAQVILSHSAHAGCVMIYLMNHVIVTLPPMGIMIKLEKLLTYHDDNAIMTTLDHPWPACVGWEPFPIDPALMI